MLKTETLINRLSENGYTHFCVVPCSFAKNLINASINSSDKIEYLPCANEAVACSVAAGLKLACKNPIVIVQSSGLTNMGSCITSLLIPYNITFPIVVSWRTYNDGDSEIQHQHLATKLPDLIAAYGYSYTLLDKCSIDKALEQIQECNFKHQICLLEKETFTKVELKDKHQLDLSQYFKRSEYLMILNEEYKNTKTIFIATTGNTAREMHTYMPDTNNFYMVGNMGGALSVGLGMAKAGKKVIVCGGDSEFVMHMGGLTTAGRYNDINLTYILFDNESNKSTGGQKTYQQHVDYINIANYSGLNIDIDIINDKSIFLNSINDNKCADRILFIHVKCGYDVSAARPPLKLVKYNVPC